MSLVLAAFAAVTLSLTTAVQAAPATPPTATAEPSCQGGAVIEDITVAVPGQFNPVRAWLVRPDGPPVPRSHAG